MTLRWEQAFDDTPDVGDFLDEHGFVISGELGHVGADAETRAMVIAAPRLAAELAEAVRLLRACEWVSAEGEQGFLPGECPSCGAQKYEGQHRDGCALSAFLRRASLSQEGG